MSDAGGFSIQTGGTHKDFYAGPCRGHLCAVAGQGF